MSKSLAAAGLVRRRMFAFYFSRGGGAEGSRFMLGGVDPALEGLSDDSIVVEQSSGHGGSFTYKITASLETGETRKFALHSRNDKTSALSNRRMAVAHKLLGDAGLSPPRLGEGLDVFVASYAPPAQMFVFGAIDFSASLVRVGKVLGYRVTVCDARPVFATAKRFPEADDVVVDWPHRWLETQDVDERTVIAVLAGSVGADGAERSHLALECVRAPIERASPPSSSQI